MPAVQGSFFGKLMGGAKFDRHRFGEDIARFRNVGGDSSTSLLPPSTLDFFGVHKPKESQQKDASPKNIVIKQMGKGNSAVSQEDDISSSDQAVEDEERGDSVNLFAHSRSKPDVPVIRSHAKNSQHESKEESARREQVSVFRKQMRINVSGSDIPDPVGSFDELSLDDDTASWLRRGIEDAGWTEPTPIQMQAIPVIMAGRDILACAPTGSGKTGAFVIPLFARLGGHRKRGGIRGLIVAPTRELAVQIHEQCNRLRAHSKMRVKLLTKATSAAIASLQAAAAAAGGDGEGGGGGTSQDVLISTPARLAAMLAEGTIKLDSVELIIIDEADKLFDEGFVGQVDEVLAACSHPRLQRALFSATIPPAVEELARSIMPHPVQVTVGSRMGAAETVKQRLVFVGTEEGKTLAIRQMVQAGELRPPVLVFVQSVERSKELFKELVYDGINVDVMHADRTQSVERSKELFKELVYDGINVDVMHTDRTQAQRDAAIRRFRTGETWVLVCTDLLARGVDFTGVRLVLNYDFPQSPVSYIHRVGRTGRAGRAGEAITLFTRDDAPMLRAIANVMVQSGCEVPAWMLTLRRAGRRERKKLARSAPPRRSIAEEPAFRRRERARIQQIVRQSKEKRDRLLAAAAGGGWDGGAAGGGVVTGGAGSAGGESVIGGTGSGGKRRREDGAGGAAHRAPAGAGEMEPSEAVVGARRRKVAAVGDGVKEVSRNEASVGKKKVSAAMGQGQRGAGFEPRGKGRTGATPAAEGMPAGSARTGVEKRKSKKAA